MEKRFYGSRSKDKKAAQQFIRRNGGKLVEVIIRGVVNYAVHK